MKRLLLSPGRALAFKDHGSRVVTLDYQEIAEKCAPDCTGHEASCFDEDYVHVVERTSYYMPLSKLETVFDPDTHIGRPFNPKWDVSER